MSNAALIWALLVTFTREALVALVVAIIVAGILLGSLVAALLVLEIAPQQRREEVRSVPSSRRPRHFEGWL